MPKITKNNSVNRMTNYMEVITEGVLEDLLNKEKQNFSDNAIRDIKALALNRLWPMYATTDSGRTYLKKVVREDNIEKDVVREIRAAMDIVRSNPR